MRGIAGFLPDGAPANELGDGWGIYDLGLSDMAMLLKAAELGLSTLVMGIRDAQLLRAALSIPEEETIVCVIAVGHGSADPQRPARKPIEETAHFL